MKRTDRATYASTPSGSDPLHRLLNEHEARELLAQAQKYDSRALTRIYHLFADRVFRFIYYRVQERSRAEELTAEVFVRMLEGVANFRFGKGDAGLQLTGWIFTIARNLVIDEYRRERTRRIIEPLPDDWEEQVDDAANLDLRITRADLQRALAQLTEEQQTVLLLRFEEGLTSAQIAQILGKTETAVKALQRQGLAAMARFLGGDRAARA